MKTTNLKKPTAQCSYSIMAPPVNGRGAVIKVNISYSEQSDVNACEPIMCAGNNSLRA